MEGSRLDEVFDQYALHPTTQYSERYIKWAVTEFGETKELHIFYLSIITVIVRQIIHENNYELLRHLVRPCTGFTESFVVDVLADMIYNSRKSYLGLESMKCPTSEFCFESATKNCAQSIDRIRVAEIMEQVRRQTVKILPKLELDKSEVVITPFIVINDNFAFHKILSVVLEKASKLELYKVTGVDTWSLYVAVYEIAHRIFDDYTSGLRRITAA